MKMTLRVLVLLWLPFAGSSVLAERSKDDAIRIDYPSAGSSDPAVPGDQAAQPAASANTGSGVQNGVLNAAAFPGNDICAKINSAYAGAPARGAHIYVASGDYSCSTQIVFATAGKMVNLEGEPGGIVTITYKGEASPFVLFANNGTNSHISWSDGLRRISLKGPGRHGKVVGVQIGSAVNGVEGFEAESISVSNFGVGVKWMEPPTSPSGGNATTWGSYFVHSTFINNGVGWQTPIGENVSCNHCLIGVDIGSIADQLQLSPGGGADLNFTDTSFDNAQINITYPYILNLKGCHIEQTYPNTSGGSGDVPPVVIAHPKAVVRMSETVFVQGSTTTYPPALVDLRSGSLSMIGIHASSNSRARMPVVNAQGSGYLNVLNPEYLSGVASPFVAYTNFIGYAVVQDYLGRMTAKAFSATAGGGNTTAMAMGTDLHGSATSLPHLLMSGDVPTIQSGFGDNAAISNANGTAAFVVNVGRGGTATRGGIGLPTANNGWNCTCSDLSNSSPSIFLCKQITSSPSSATIANFSASGIPAPWASGDYLQVSCLAR